MRLGLLIYGSLETISGGYLYDRRLVEYLRKQGHQVEIISLPWRNYARHLGDNFNPALLHELAGIQVDVLLQDELNHPSLFWLNHRLRAITNTPIICIVHHLRLSEQQPSWVRPLYRLVERKYLQSVDGFIFNSRTTQRAVESGLGRAAEGMIATPAGNRFGPPVSDQHILARAAQSPPLKIVFLGNLIPRKGLHSLLRALEELPPDCWELTVIGNLQADPGYTRRIRRRSSRLPGGSRVDLAGALSDAELKRRLSEAHALAVPSCYEGFGIAYLEGMGFGLPAIGGQTGAASEIIQPGWNGFLVPAGDHQAIAAALQSLISDREKLIQISRNARQTFLSFPGWEQTFSAVPQYLHGIIQTTRG